MKRAILGLVLMGVAPVSAMASDRGYGGHDGGPRFKASIRIGGGHGGGDRPAPVVHERVIEHRDEPVVVHREETVIDHYGRETVIHRHDVAVEHRYVPVDRHREVYVRPAPHDYRRQDAHVSRGH